MQRLIVALLAALDAAIAAAVGVASVLAPLTLLWVLAFGLDADWGALWPLSGTLWQFGHAVPLAVVLPDALVSSLGIAEEASRFALSVPPLALMLFTLLFAARSGRRAAAAGRWMAGVAGGVIAFTVLSAAIAVSAGFEVLRAPLAAAIVIPAAVYALGALAGAVSHAWTEGDDGPVDRLRDLVDSTGDWAAVPGEIVGGSAVVAVALTGASAVGLALMTVLRGGEVVALFEAAHVDVLGAIMLTLMHLAYLPTLLIWAASWLAGPGFSIGVGTAVSPAGTDLGVVPGIPVLGLVPAHSSFWMLVSVLVPIACGAVAGWMVRSRLAWENTATGYGPRAAIAAGIAVVSAGIAALAALLASGSIGPGRLAEAGPAIGPFALAIGIEVLIGAGILLLAPRHRDELAEERIDRWNEEMAGLTAPID